MTIIRRGVMRIGIKMCLTPHQPCLLHRPPEIQPVLPRAVQPEQQPKLFMLQTIHFDSPNRSTSSFWQDRDSWLKNNEEKLPDVMEPPYLQPDASRGRGRVSAAELAAQRRSLPTSPFLFSGSPCLRIVNGLPASHHRGAQ